MLVLVAISIFLYPAQYTVNAAPVSGLLISPLRSYPTLDPGATTSSSITLSNLTKDQQIIDLETELFTVVNENYDYNFVPSENASWVKFADTQVVLSPKQTLSVAYSLAVPADAAPGGHYFALIASTNAATSSSRLTEVRRLASLVYLQVNGILKKDSQLLSFEMPWFTSGRTVDIQAQLINKGNTHFRARLGVAATRQPFGRSIELTQAENLILPGTVRRIGGTVTLPNMPGLYKIVVIYAPPTGPVQTIRRTVLYIPLWLQLIVLAIGAAAGVWWMWYGRVRFKKSADS